MLTWTQQADGWYANGFRIELRAHRHWVLVDLEADSTRVLTDLEPLAAETTLSHCKREAEILTAARRRSQLRRRHARFLVMILAAVIILLGQSQMMNTAVILAAVFVALRSLGVILGTFTWNNLGTVHEVFYQ